MHILYFNFYWSNGQFLLFIPMKQFQFSAKRCRSLWNNEVINLSGSEEWRADQSRWWVLLYSCCARHKSMPLLFRFMCISVCTIRISHFNCHTTCVPFFFGFNFFMFRLHQMIPTVVVGECESFFFCSLFPEMVCDGKGQWQVRNDRAKPPTAYYYNIDGWQQVADNSSGVLCCILYVCDCDCDYDCSALFGSLASDEEMPFLVNYSHAITSNKINFWSIADEGEKSLGHQMEAFGCRLSGFVWHKPKSIDSISGDFSSWMREHRSKMLKTIHLRIIFKLRKQDWLKVFHYINLIAIVACRILDVHIIHSNQTGYAACFAVATVGVQSSRHTSGSIIRTHIEQVRICNMYALEICTQFLFFFLSRMSWDCGQRKWNHKTLLHTFSCIYTWGMDMKLCGMSQIQKRNEWVLIFE